MPGYIWGALFIVLSSIIYAWGSLHLEKVTQKMNIPDSWLSYIPFVNIYLVCKVPGKLGWRGLLFIIPLIDIVILGIVITICITMAA
jgi:hypothetical protein